MRVGQRRERARAAEAAAVARDARRSARGSGRVGGRGGARRSSPAVSGMRTSAEAWESGDGGGVSGGRGGGGRAGLGEQFFQAGGRDAAEGHVVAGTVEDGHLELGGGEVDGLAAVDRGTERGQRGGKRLGQGHVVGVAFL